jgi:hypothetical protein
MRVARATTPSAPPLKVAQYRRSETEPHLERFSHIASTSVADNGASYFDQILIRYEG